MLKWLSSSSSPLCVMLHLKINAALSNCTQETLACWFARSYFNCFLSECVVSHTKKILSGNHSVDKYLCKSYTFLLKSAFFFFLPPGLVRPLMMDHFTSGWFEFTLSHVTTHPYHPTIVICQKGKWQKQNKSRDIEIYIRNPWGSVKNTLLPRSKV